MFDKPGAVTDKRPPRNRKNIENYEHKIRTAGNQKGERGKKLQLNGVRN